MAWLVSATCMRSGKLWTVRLGTALLLLLTLLSASRLSADAVTGTYTGSVALRGNYYWERSTRVMAPSLTAAVETPQGVRVDGTYLIDAITSASQATGVLTDNTFREIRHDAQAGVGHEFDFGKTQLDLMVRGRFSREPDYQSRNLGIVAALSLFERNTVLRFNGNYLNDDVYRVTRMAASTGPLVATKPLHVGDLQTVVLGLAWDQVLSPLATLTLGYDLAVLHGYLANPYRAALFRDGAPKAETHPDLRVRNGMYFWFSHYLKATSSALRVGYRLYQDNWGITAHAAEGRIYQELGEHVMLRLRYRYYHQDQAEFWRLGGNLESDTYFTADPKMSPFPDQTFGLKLRVALGFLSNTALRTFQQAVLDLSGEYMISESRYGNGVIGQGGILFPF